LQGDPAPIADRVGADGILGAFSASTNGTLVYISGATGAHAVWYDREGTMLGDAGEGGITVALSPDGTRAATTVLPASGEDVWNVWLIEITRKARTRFTFGSGRDGDPVWSADGSRIVYVSTRGDHIDLLQKLSSGAGDEELLVQSNELKSPTSLSYDGRYLLFTSVNPKTNSDVWLLPMLAGNGPRNPIRLLSSTFHESHASFSPDSRWLAYISDESGRNEAYVRTFHPPDNGKAANADGKILVSNNGAETIRWRRDGKELFYETPDGTIMSVEIMPGSSFAPGTPQRLFQTNAIVGARYWDVTADGKRFLVGMLGGRNAQTPFTVVLNWHASLGN
jgi:Tol biopolymer transport system component